MIHRRTGLPLLAVLLAVVVGACGSAPSPEPATPTPQPGASSGGVAGSPSASPAPQPGHELYGFLPYWEMDETIADHLAQTPLTTLGLFSVTHTGKGAIRDAQGYKLIAGPLGRRIIDDAHARGVAVEVVYTSFGAARNRKLFESATLQATVIDSLVGLVGELGVDGVNVDVEALDPELVPAYGAFVANLRAAVLAADAGDQVSVATGAGTLGAGMAVAATEARADRIFLMGYDYRTGRSAPGATSPLARRDDPFQPSLQTSLDLYAALGVPPERTLLGLPLYGVVWPVAGPVVGAPSTGRGQAWILRKHVDLLADPGLVPVRDELEMVEVYLLGSDGTVGPPPPDPSPSGDSSAPTAPTPEATAAARTWEAIYVDSPATLEPKLALADERGLAGAGFWAIGYERGLPAYTELMKRFRDGALSP